MVLRIYKPSKTAMQSGRFKTKNWIAEYISSESLEKDSLMGWNSSKDTKTQIKIYFNTYAIASSISPSFRFTETILLTPSSCWVMPYI